MTFNIGDIIEYENEYGEKCRGEVTEVSSDMDSYEEMELKDGIPYYASKKLTASENRRKNLRYPLLCLPLLRKRIWILSFLPSTLA